MFVSFPRGQFVSYRGGDRSKAFVEERVWRNSDFNFDDVSQGMLTLFTVATFEGWPGSDNLNITYAYLCYTIILRIFQPKERHNTLICIGQRQLMKIYILFNDDTDAVADADFDAAADADFVTVADATAAAADNDADEEEAAEDYEYNNNNYEKKNDNNKMIIVIG